MVGDCIIRGLFLLFYSITAIVKVYHCKHKHSSKQKQMFFILVRKGAVKEEISLQINTFC